MRRILDDLDAGAYVYEPPPVSDLKRAAAIDRKFASLELGLVDATVAALAERIGAPVLTTDSDFTVLRVGARWDVALELSIVPTRRRKK